MAYLGRQPISGNFQVLDAIVATTTDTYALTKDTVAVFPQTPSNCIVSLNGVIQAPTDSYTISGSDIVFASALTGSDSIDFITVLGDVLNIGTPTDGTVTTAKLADSSVTLAKLTATGTQDATTFLRGDNTFAEPSGGFSSGTAVATTSGTSIDITGIPSGVTEITVLFKAVSTNGSSAVSIQIGDGSIVTTGYTNIGGGMSASSLTNTQFTNGFVLMDSTDTTWILTGYFTLKGYGNNWFIFGGGVRDTTYPCYSFGGKTLSGTLDRVRITTTGGSDTFDAGEVNITYI
jgi:hypothetical protein